MQIIITVVEAVQIIMVIIRNDWEKTSLIKGVQLKYQFKAE